MSWVVTHEAATTIKNTCGITRSALKKLLVDVFFLTLAGIHTGQADGKQQLYWKMLLFSVRPSSRSNPPKYPKVPKMPKCQNAQKIGVARGCEGLRGVASSGCDLAKEFTQAVGGLNQWHGTSPQADAPSSGARSADRSGAIGLEIRALVRYGRYTHMAGGDVCSLIRT